MEIRIGAKKLLNKARRSSPPSPPQFLLLAVVSQALLLLLRRMTLQDPRCNEPSFRHIGPMTTHGPHRAKATHAGLKPPTPTWNPPIHGPTPIWSHPLRSQISSLSFSLTASTTPISKSPMPPLQHLAFASESNFALNSLLWIFLNFWRFFSMLGFGLRALSPWILFLSNLMHSFSL